MPLILSSHPAAPPSCLSYLFLPTLVSLISFCKAARPRGSRRSGSGVGAPGGAGRGRGLAPASARVEAAVRPRRGSRRRTGLGPSPSVGVARPRARARPGSGVVAAHPLWRRYGAPPASGRPVSPPVRPDPPPPARVEGRAGGQRRLDMCASAASARWLPLPCGRIRFHPPRPDLHPHCLRRPPSQLAPASSSPYAAEAAGGSAIFGGSGAREWDRSCSSGRRTREGRPRQQRPEDAACASGTGDASAAEVRGARERDGHGSSGRGTRRARAGQALQQWPAYGARERGTAAAAAAGGRGAGQWDGRCICGGGTRRAREGRPRQQRWGDAANASRTGAGEGAAIAAGGRSAREPDGGGRSSSGRRTRRVQAGRASQ